MCTVKWRRMCYEHNNITIKKGGKALTSFKEKNRANTSCCLTLIWLTLSHSTHLAYVSRGNSGRRRGESQQEVGKDPPIEVLHTHNKYSEIQTSMNARENAFIFRIFSLFFQYDLEILRNLKYFFICEVKC